MDNIGTEQLETEVPEAFAKKEVRSFDVLRAVGKRPQKQEKTLIFIATGVGVLAGGGHGLSAQLQLTTESFSTIVSHLTLLRATGKLDGANAAYSPTTVPATEPLSRPAVTTKSYIVETP